MRKDLPEGGGNLRIMDETGKKCLHLGEIERILQAHVLYDDTLIALGYVCRGQSDGIA